MLISDDCYTYQLTVGFHLLVTDKTPDLSRWQKGFCSLLFLGMLLQHFVPAAHLITVPRGNYFASCKLSCHCSVDKRGRQQEYNPTPIRAGEEHTSNQILKPWELSLPCYCFPA